MARKMYPKLTDLDAPRIRFNWGFHDGTHDAVTDYQRKADTLDCQPQAYQAGYAAGQAEVKRTGTRPDDSGAAWKAFLSSLTKDERTRVYYHQLHCTIGGLENCLRRRADERMIDKAMKYTDEAMGVTA